MSNFLTEEDEMDVLLGGQEAHQPLTKKPSRKKESFCDFKLISFIIIGGLTLVYVVIELGVAVWLKSLALLSDGFHNLSDVISLYIAFWAVRASKREANDAMSYGWVRAELIGGLINGCFLLSLSLYVLLEAIPRFIEPETLNSGWWFISVAAGGLVVNTVGTIVFAFAGISHGHSHSHGGHGGHGHGGHGGHSHGGHDHGKKKKKEKHEHGHGHGHGDKKKKDKHEHDDHEGHEGHSHGEKKDKHGHGHGHDHHDNHEHFAEHGHDENGRQTDIEVGVVHVHKEKKVKKEKHGHGHGEKKDKHGHGHGHGDKRRRVKKEKSKWKIDLNVWAVFIHYLGDMVSSLMILITGLILKYLEGKWTDYIDPAVSVLIVALILWTTIPLVKKCSIILLQSTPEEMEMELLREDLLAIPGVESVHELHVWGLTDGMIVSSVHMQVEEGVEWRSMVKHAREVLHEHGIHSSCIQPEFVPKNKPLKEYCEENCVRNCEEDWCCKKKADRLREDPFAI